MREPAFLLCFESRDQALAVLGELGLWLEEDPNRRHAPSDGRLTSRPAFGDGIVRHLTGETAQFEGEAIAFSAAQPGFHVLVDGAATLPAALLPYRVFSGTE
jgi:hypothetical protein